MAMQIAHESDASSAQAISVAERQRHLRLFRSIDESAFTSRHKALYAAVNAAHFFDGFDLTMISVVLPGMVVAFSMNAAQAGVVASSAFLGMFFGAILIPPIGDRVGRKMALLLSIGFYSLVSLAMVFAHNYHTALALRFLQGVGLGAEVPIVFTYLSEFVPTRRRGALLAWSVSVWQASAVVAALIAIPIIPALGWRAMFVIGAVPLLILIAVWGQIPESVRYLVRRGRTDEAEQIVRRFSSVDPDTVTVTVSGVPERAASVMDVLRGRYLRVTLGAWLMNICWGMSFFGVGVWLPTILIRLGFTMVHSFAFTGLIIAAEVVGSLTTGVYLDIFGRRASLTGLHLLAGAGMIAWGYATTPVAILLLGAVTAYALGGLAGSLFTYVCEIYPTRYRATGAGWATACQRIGGVIAPAVLGMLMAKDFGAMSSFLLLGIVLVGGAVAALFLTFETKGWSLEDISVALAE